MIWLVLLTGILGILGMLHVDYTHKKALPGILKEHLTGFVKQLVKDKLLNSDGKKLIKSDQESGRFDWY